MFGFIRGSGLCSVSYRAAQQPRVRRQSPSTACAHPCDNVADGRDGGDACAAVRRRSGAATPRQCFFCSVLGGVQQGFRSTSELFWTIPGQICMGDVHFLSKIAFKPIYGSISTQNQANRLDFLFHISSSLFCNNRFPFLRTVLDDDGTDPPSVLS